MGKKKQANNPHPNVSGRKTHIDNGTISEHAHSPKYVWSCYDSLAQTLIFLETISIFSPLICHKKNNVKTKDTLWNISTKDMHSNSSTINLPSKKHDKKLCVYIVKWSRNTSHITTYWTPLAPTTKPVTFMRTEMFAYR